MKSDWQKIIDKLVNEEQTHCVCGEEIDPKIHWIRLGKKWCSKKCAEEAKMSEKEADKFMEILMQPDSVLKEEVAIYLGSKKKE